MRESSPIPSPSARRHSTEYRPTNSNAARHSSRTADRISSRSYSCTESRLSTQLASRDPFSLRIETYSRRDFTRRCPVSRPAGEFRRIKTIAVSSPKRADRSTSRNSDSSAASRLVSLSVFLIALAILMFSLIALDASDRNERFAYARGLPIETVVVQAGDTIDGIAAEHPVRGLSDHELGWVIEEMNPGITGLIQPGDRLAVPVDLPM